MSFAKCSIVILDDTLPVDTRAIIHMAACARITLQLMCAIQIDRRNEQPREPLPAWSRPHQIFPACRVRQRRWCHLFWLAQSCSPAGRNFQRTPPEKSGNLSFALKRLRSHCVKTIFLRALVMLFYNGFEQTQKAPGQLQMHSVTASAHLISCFCQPPSLALEHEKFLRVGQACQLYLPWRQRSSDDQAAAGTA